MRKHKKLFKQKKHCQNLHFKSRLKERYGIELNRQDRLDIVNLIQANDSRFFFLRRETTRLRWWVVDYKGKLFPVVYDANRHVLVTALNWIWVPMDKRKEALSYFRTQQVPPYKLTELKESIDSGVEEVIRVSVTCKDEESL